tara:strand:+ start:3168 stop:4070 length:903 start_codon:yes stop_codon:yes gene_type:complete
MIVVDYNQTAIGSFMAEARGRTDVEPNLDLLRHMIINSIRSYNKRWSPEFGELVIACDNRHYWRRQVFPFYKAGRKVSRQRSGMDWNAIFEAVNLVRDEIAEVFPYPVIDVDGAEADDVIGTLAEYSQTHGTIPQEAGQLPFDEFIPDPFLIISGDHDFKQLQKWGNIKQYAPAQKKWVKITEPAEVVLREHIIVGDKGDGIPNMLSDDDVFVEGKRQTPIRKVKLNKWKYLPPEEWVSGELAAGYVRNSTLVDLTKTPEDIKESIINNYKSQQGQDRSLLLNYFMKYKMKHMIDVIDDF